MPRTWLRTLCSRLSPANTPPNSSTSLARSPKIFRVVVGGDQTFDVVLDASGVAVQVDAGRACGVGVQVERHAVDDIVDGVAAASDFQAVDLEAGIGSSLQILVKERLLGV
jgi:hypothetical protein